MVFAKSEGRTLELRKAKKRLAVQRDSNCEEVFRVWFQVRTRVAMQKEDPATLAHPLDSDHYACVDNGSFDDVHYSFSCRGGSGESPCGSEAEVDRSWLSRPS
jgi:hypothetical protein